MHWTYALPKSDDLAQGDVLEPTDELRALLHEIHPHFAKPKYVAFCVLTQSCDLVRRGKQPECNARYISIAPIRPLKSVALRLIEQVAEPVDKSVQGLFRSQSKARAREMFTRIFNQNEQALGLFYYHPNPDAGIGESCAAFLRVSVALRAQHYEKLLAARRLSLTAEFQAKFGWLVGNLYSRAATIDWYDEVERKKELERLVSVHLEGSSPDQPALWVDDAVVEAANKKGAEISGLTPTAAKQQLELHRPPPKTDTMAEAALEVVARTLGDANITLPEDVATRLKHRLKQDARLRQLLR